MRTRIAIALLALSVFAQTIGFAEPLNPAGEAQWVIDTVWCMEDSGLLDCEQWINGPVSVDDYYNIWALGWLFIPNDISEMYGDFPCQEMGLVEAASNIYLYDYPYVQPLSKGEEEDGGRWVRSGFNLICETTEDPQRLVNELIARRAVKLVIEQGSWAIQPGERELPIIDVFPEAENLTFISVDKGTNLEAGFSVRPSDEDGGSVRVAAELHQITMDMLTDRNSPHAWALGYMEWGDSCWFLDIHVDQPENGRPYQSAMLVSGSGANVLATKNHPYRFGGDRFYSIGLYIEDGFYVAVISMEKGLESEKLIQQFKQDEWMLYLSPDPLLYGCGIEEPDGDVADVWTTAVSIQLIE